MDKERTLTLLDPFLWLKDRVKQAVDAKDPARSVPLLKKMLAIAHGNQDMLRYAHTALADAYGVLGDFTKMKKHQTAALALSPVDSLTLPAEIPWGDVGDRMLDYRDYLAKGPAPLLTFSQWRVLDDELLMLLYWLNLRDLTTNESARLSYLQQILLQQ